MSKQLYLFSQCFGNSNSCFQIKSCGSIFDPNYPFYHKFGRQSFWTGMGVSIPVLHQTVKSSKEIELDISVFLDYSVLC